MTHGIGIILIIGCIKVDNVIEMHDKPHTFLHTVVDKMLFWLTNIVYVYARSNDPINYMHHSI